MGRPRRTRFDICLSLWPGHGQAPESRKSIKIGNRIRSKRLGNRRGHSSGSVTMPEGLSMYAEKVYNAMKNAELNSEEKMANADRIVGLAKAPKNFVLRALDELQSKGLVKRKAREKAAGYYLVQQQQQQQ